MNPPCSAAGTTGPAMISWSTSDGSLRKQHVSTKVAQGTKHLSFQYCREIYWSRRITPSEGQLDKVTGERRRAQLIGPAIISKIVLVA